MRGKFETLIVAGTLMLVSGMPAPAPAGPGSMGGRLGFQGQVRMADPAGPGRMQFRGADPGFGNGFSRDPMPRRGNEILPGDGAGRPGWTGTPVKEMEKAGADRHDGRARETRGEFRNLRSGTDGFDDGAERAGRHEDGPGRIAGDGPAQWRGDADGPVRSVVDRDGTRGNEDVGSPSRR